MARSEVRLHYADYGGEISGVRIPIAAINVGNFAAMETKITTLAAAIDAIVLGLRVKTERLARIATFEQAMPASPFAQREVKWRVKYHRNTTFKKGSLEVPTADLAKLSPDSNERALMTDSDIAAFVAAFEAGVQAGGEAVTIDDMYFVPRKA